MRRTRTSLRLIATAILLAAIVVAIDDPATRPVAGDRATGWPTAAILQSAVVGHPGPHPHTRAARAGSDTQPGPGIDTPAPPGFRPSPNTLLPTGTPLGTPAPPPAATGTPKTYRVYATREGLVGHTTANGHKVVANDHFVSLPSWRALSPKGGNDYSVRACSVANGRCVYEPVWDVGPWNTGDAYWAADRGDWPKVPRGTPEAQAAYQDGYNNGKDQFGREVVNPAGIDLADGAIRDGLGFASSAWVKVTFLWTGGGLRGAVDAGGSVLHVRGGPTTADAIVGLAGPYAQLPIECRTPGQVVTNPSGSSTKRWYRVGAGNYVSAAYVKVPAATKSKINRC